MTATLYPSPRADRITPRPVGRTSGDLDHLDRRPAARDRDANYAARRGVAAVIAVLVVASLAIAASTLVGALVDVGARPAAASVAAASDVPGGRVHVAQPGDSLWSIADRYRGEVGQRRFVDALIDVNGDTAIQVGQAVRLP